MTLNVNPIRAKSQAVWLETVSGEYAQAHEQHLYDEAVFDLFGFNALQMGCIDADLLKNSRIPNLFAASDYVSENCDLKCEDDFLPFAPLSLDLLLLPHRLEFSERPHQTLREAERVIMPEGHLIISCFNPISTWGIKFLVKKLVYRIFLKKRGDYPEKMYPWNGRLITLARLKDWLALLGFEVVSVKRTCHVPPFNSERLHNRFSFLDKLCKKSLGYLGCNRFGGIYFVVAKKRVHGVTPLKPKWKAPKIPKVLIPTPSSRRANKNKHPTNNKINADDNA